MIDSIIHLVIIIAAGIFLILIGFVYLKKSLFSKEKDRSFGILSLIIGIIIIVSSIFSGLFQAIGFIILLLDFSGWWIGYGVFIISQDYSKISFMGEKSGITFLIVGIMMLILSILVIFLMPFLS